MHVYMYYVPCSEEKVCTPSPTRLTSRWEAGLQISCIIDDISMELYSNEQNLGDEKEAWSDDDDDNTDTEDGAKKLAGSTQGAETARTDVTTYQTRDGYSSGDLGDVSQFYPTEVPDEKDSDSDQETTPRKGFKERYAIAVADKDDSSNLFEQPVTRGKAAMEDGGGTESQDVEKVAGEVTEEVKGLDLPLEDLVDRILDAMWGYCHAYHISNSVSQSETVSYMMQQHRALMHTRQCTLSMVLFASIIFSEFSESILIR